MGIATRFRSGRSLFSIHLPWQIFARAFLGLWLIATSPLLATPDLELDGQPVRTITASGIEVKVYPSARLHTGTTGRSETSLQLTGSGIRHLSVGLLSADVYVIASYADPSARRTAHPRQAIERSPFKAVQLTMLRDANAAEIQQGFEEALDANGIDVTQSPLGKLLDKIDFDVSAGAQVTIAAYPLAGGEEQLVIDAPDHSIRLQGKGISADLWKVWFGVPYDSNLEQLQKELVGGCY